jgi:hypothetical protein
MARSGRGLTVSFDCIISRGEKLVVRSFTIDAPSPPPATAGIKDVWEYYWEAKRYQQLLKYHENRVRLVNDNRPSSFPRRLRWGEPMPSTLLGAIIWVQIIKGWRKVLRLRRSTKSK